MTWFSDSSRAGRKRSLRLLWFLLLFLAGARCEVMAQESATPGDALADPAQSNAASNRWARQEAYWRTAVQEDPANPAAHAGLGRSLYQQRRFTEAIAEYLQTLKLDPNY